MEPRFARIAEVPRGVVASLAQDRTGFIWFGGGNGLTRYDGYRLQVVDRDTKDLARRNLGWIRALLADEDGRLWIGTEADGVAVHDPASGRTQDVPYGGPGAPPTVLALAADGAGGLWVGTAGGGLQHYTPGSPLLQREDAVFAGPTAPGGPGDRVMALHRARDGTLWLGSERGLARLPAGSRELEAVAFPPIGRDHGPGVADPVQALRQMADGRLWIGTQGGRLAIAAADGSEVQWLDGAAAPGAAAQVTALAQDRDGTVWVGRSSGVDLRTAEGRLLRRLRTMRGARSAWPPTK
jgi:ligand-binding sensor domain-containing protein